MTPLKNRQAGDGVTIDMIKAGVDLYFSFSYEDDEPETLVAEILLTARDMRMGKIKCEI